MLDTISSKDPAIKLFGKEISLLTDVDSPTVSSGEVSPIGLHQDEQNQEIVKKDCPAENEAGSTQDVDDAPATNADETADGETAAESSVNPQTPSINEESTKSNASKSEQQEKTTLKKPDKILPCPRCNSMDTKFCYYNNYNVNQPRHFCKACQRYWTAGGTMRNVPVGAGRRKTKNSASHYHHITISEALQAARIDSPNGTSELKSNCRVLSFGLDPPVADKKVLNGTRNENGDDCSSASSAVSSSMEMGLRHSENSFIPNGFASPVPCLPGIPWHPYPWNSALPFCPPGYPIFYPAATYWSVPFPSQQPANRNAAASSSPTSPALGKHSRDADSAKPEESPPKRNNGCVLVPKTLRIDDPSEAAKSSIWSTLGIKNESVSNGAVLKAFQPKSDKRSNLAERSPVLRANPAALCRSIDFHERS